MTDLWQHSATDLASLIARGEISSVDVVEAHIARIETIDTGLNATCVRRFGTAREEAREADAARARGDVLGALHGVPVSIKEQLDVAGIPSTFGITTRANDVAENDDPYVARWRAAGAIVVAKTNVSQLMIFIETDNPLYGRTNNPWDLARTCGGSSGGEAALIAAGGSPLGLGTDIGGSLRVPAAFCGIASLKPTAGRLNDASRVTASAGQEAIRSQAGPLARTVADLSLGFALAHGEPQSDRFARPHGDAHAIDIAGLRVGTYEHLGSFAASPALARATSEAAAALRARGATVVRFEPPHIDDARDIFYGVLAADGGRGAQGELDSSPVDTRVAKLLDLASKPRPMIAAIEKLLALLGQRETVALARNFGFTDTAHYWKLIAAQNAYRRLFTAAMDTATGGPLDLIIAPPVGLPALRHGASVDVSTAGMYAPLYNVLGYPAGTLPWTRVRAEEECGRKSSRDRVLRAARATERGSTGLPIGVQLIARPWREDIVLAAMFALEADARLRADYPVTPIDPRGADDRSRSKAAR